MSVHDNITSLLRLSMSVRNPTPHDQFMNSPQIDTSSFEAFDIRHTREKFPSAPESLVINLGKAISRRRGYFMYRESQGKKLPSSITVGVEMPSRQTDAGETPEATPRSTKDTRFSLDMKPDRRSDSSLTQSSLAASASELPGEKIPSLPKFGRGGDPFLCPFCFMIICRLQACLEETCVERPTSIRLHLPFMLSLQPIV